MKVFYARVSSINQNEARQLEQAKEVNADKVFIDKASGKNTDRKSFKEMMSFVREGDEIIVSDISRLGRNSKDILLTIEELNSRGVSFRSIKEGFNTDNAQGRFVLQIFSALAELERETIRERQAEGIALAKERGVYKGRRALDLDTDEFRRYAKDWREGKRTAVECMKHFNISSPTWYRKIKEYNL